MQLKASLFSLRILVLLPMLPVLLLLDQVPQDCLQLSFLILSLVSQHPKHAVILFQSG